MSFIRTNVVAFAAGAGAAAAYGVSALGEAGAGLAAGIELKKKKKWRELSDIFPLRGNRAWKLVERVR